MSRNEVKGVWFVTARDYVAERHGQARLDAMVQRMGPQMGPTLADPAVSAWYPEGHLQAMLRALDAELAAGDPDRFVDEIVGCSEQGMGRFFRSLARLASPGFVLRQSPTTWKMLRRGPGTMQAQRVDGGTLIRYREFPYFHDPLYRLMAVGTVQSLVEVSTGARVAVEVAHWAASELDLAVSHG